MQDRVSGPFFVAAFVVHAESSGQERWRTLGGN